MRVVVNRQPMTTKEADKEKFTREVLDNKHDESLNIDYSHVLYKRRH